MASNRKLALLTGLAALSLTALCLTAPAAENSSGDCVFQIGLFDGSSAEFAKGTPDHPVIFVAGQSDAKTNWYASQSAVRSSEAVTTTKGDSKGPRTIQFRISGAASPAYRLKVSLLFETQSVPALRVTINDKRGMFYSLPKLDPRLGDTSGAFNPVYSTADIAFDFPSNYLRQGANTITLQAVEESDQPVPGASFTYDAIELDRIQKNAAHLESSAQILPTVFYRQIQGQLSELVDVIIRSTKPIKPEGKVDFTVAGKHYSQQFGEGLDFGEAKVEIPVAEFAAQSIAEVSWSEGSARRHQKQTIDPEKKWTLLLVPLIHLDVGFSDYQSKIAVIHSRIIDEAMDMTAQHPAFRFSLDGEWPLAQFLTTRTPSEQQRAITAIQQKQLFVPGQYANLLTGFPTAETLIRSLYPSANFSREHGTPFNYANITDAPSYSWSYASILASAGIKDFIAASNNHRAPVLVQGHLNENSPFWWEGPDGQKILFWYSRQYNQMTKLFALPPVPSAGHDTIPIFLQQYRHPSYHASAAIIYGTQAENNNLVPQQAELADKWNKLYAYPKIEYSGFFDAMENIRQQLGNDIPTIRGDGGPYWELGIGSDAYYSALERENESRGTSAEKLSTLASLIDPRVAVDKGTLDQMWSEMLLMDEHTWASGNSVRDPASLEATEQLKVKDSHAIQAHAFADSLIRSGTATLADSISAGNHSILVFNTLNWARSGLVEFDLNKADELVDAATGLAVPVEIVRSEHDLNHVRFVAQNVPSLGYKVYFLRPSRKPIASENATQLTSLESPYYRVELDPESGAVRSIFDKELQRELVNSKSEYRFGQYLYVTDTDPGANNPETWYRDKLDLQINASHNGKLVSVKRTPYGWEAHMESAAANTPEIATEIRLFEHEKKIEFVEDLKKDYVTTKEAVYFAFPFAIDDPKFRYEIQTGSVDPSKDMYPGAGHEWFSVQHWAAVQGDGVAAAVMPLDDSLVTLGDIDRGTWPTQFGKRPGTIFSFAMNNYWEDNYRAGQGGDFRFRFVVTSARSTDEKGLSHMGWEEITPLEEEEITHQDKEFNQPTPLNGKQESFLEIADPSLLLDTWKPAEDGNGTILRFLDLGGSTRSVEVRLPYFQLQDAWQTDAVERNTNRLAIKGESGFTITVHPHEIVTVRVLLKKTTQAAEVTSD